MTSLDIYQCHDPEGDWIRDQQTAICTNDDQCQAAADEHGPDCPVEKQLQDEFGGF